MVSYTRARAEALGVECKVGIASRAVRVVILSIGILFADLGLLAPSVYVLAALGTHHGPAAHLPRSLGTPRERADRLTLVTRRTRPTYFRARPCS